MRMKNRRTSWVESGALTYSTHALNEVSLVDDFTTRRSLREDVLTTTNVLAVRIVV